MENLDTLILNTLRNILHRNGLHRTPLLTINQLGHTVEEYHFEQDDISSSVLLDLITKFNKPFKQKKIKYYKIKSIDEGFKECSICIQDYNLGEYRKTLNCEHTFHKKCIDRWLKKSNNCPLCRQNVYTF